MNVDHPLYAEEPRFILLDRRDEQEIFPEDNPKEDDPFFVTRGRRQYKIPFASEYGQSLWASMGRLQDLVSDEKMFRASRSRRTENDFLDSAEEPFRAAEEKRSSFRFAEDLRHRYGFPKSLSGNGPCWSSRGRRSAIGDSKNMNGFLKSLSADDPFWISRGRRNDGGLRDMPQRRGGLLGSFLTEEPEPFWVARGRRGFLDFLPTEEPFSAARGKKESPRMAAASQEELLSQIRSRNIQSKADHWLPMRGKRVADTDSNNEDERYWSALEKRTQNKTTDRILTS